MKLWKKWTALLMALLMVAAMAACTPTQEQTDPTDTSTEQTDAPTEQTQQTEETTVPEETEDVSAYSAFLGTWYEGGSSVANCLILDEEKNWKYTDASGELLLNGYFSVAEDGSLELYNNDVEMVTAMKLEDESNAYLEPCIDVAFELIQNNSFSKEITNSDQPGDDILGEDVSGVVEDPVVDVEDLPAEGGE